MCTQIWCNFYDLSFKSQMFRIFSENKVKNKKHTLFHIFSTLFWKLKTVILALFSQYRFYFVISSGSCGARDVQEYFTV